MKTFFRAALSLFVGIFGLFFLILAYTDYSTKSGHSSWIARDTTVSFAGIEKNPKGWYCPKVSLTFTQETVPTVANLRFQDPVCTSSESSAKEKIRRYVVGEKMKVYVDRNKLTEAIREPLSLGLMFYAGILLGPIFIFLAFRVFRGK